MIWYIYIYIYTHTHTHSNSTLKNLIWTKSLKLIKQPCDSPYYINWGFSLPVNFLSSPITFFFFFSWDIYGFTVGFSHTFTILYQLKFFSVGQLLIFTNNFFFFSGIYTVLQLALATLSPYYINWCFSLPVNFLSSPITFFFFFFFLSGIYTVLQLALATLSPYYIDWSFSLPVNFYLHQ